MFPISTSYTDARQNLASLLDRIEQENAVALVTRRGHKDIAILPAEELIALTESLHLLRSPKNAQRLFAALEESIARDAQSDHNLPDESLAKLIDDCQK
ncbi:type II toxin-antitoxin system Phd/YefM family antitoxin [Pleurocapsa sp. PCC 7319]|uniref:type II toxin-antitoxin system Phd/YefM family antitoxin n=1 Tax=Pleurocapsa sp. PCC 7319 TaxID=118161 RepID=UPI00036F22B0|nr:type II toxin-antitoxin system prevent-host-death family antitoxin [Pleurocapsa sp. PCC 7319]